VGIAGGMVIILLMATQNLLITFGAAVILGGPAIYLAFGKINGEKVPKMLSMALKFFIGTKVCLWQKRGEEGMSLKEVKKIIEEKKKAEKRQFGESKLKKIAWEIQTGKK
jgi:hypothetical protein